MNACSHSTLFLNALLPVCENSSKRQTKRVFFAQHTQVSEHELRCDTAGKQMQSTATAVALFTDEEDNIETSLHERSFSVPIEA